MPTDFSFDKRVAHLYNQQRAHPPEVSKAIGEGVAALVGAGGRVLEIGVGTGRIARPVAGAGCRVVGFDLSPEMLGEMLSETAIDVLQADMHAMPFRAGAFDAVMATHVFHLSKDLLTLLGETARMLTPSGLFLRGKDWIDPASVVGMLRNHLRVLAVKHAPNLMPPSAGLSIDETLAERGGTELSEHILAEWTTEISANQRLEIVQNKLDAESWIIPQELFPTIFAELQEFARQNWDDLDKPQTVTRRFTVRVTQGHWT